MNASTPHRDRRAVVTGASSGIGAAIARRLLLEGWNVIALSRTRPDDTDSRMEFRSVDLADEASLMAVADSLGPVDALVHAAGILRVGAVGEMDPADGRLMWRLHVEAAALLLNTVVPTLPRGGRVVFIGSRTARGSHSRGQYAATKAALLGLARSCAIETAPRGITVNLVSPGATDTPMLSDPARQSLPPTLPPIGRLIRPEEVAAVTAFLLSDDAGAITGQEILVCGGASL